MNLKTSSATLTSALSRLWLLPLALIALAACNAQNPAPATSTQEPASVTFTEPAEVAARQNLEITPPGSSAADFSDNPSSAASLAPLGTGSRTVGTLKLSACGGQSGSLGALCGTVHVPLDWADANAPDISVGFEFYPASGTAVGTVVPIEGGPGYASTDSRDAFLGVYGELRGNRNVLLFDRRGTGRSSVLKCQSLQRFTNASSRAVYLSAVEACGRQLDQSYKYTSGSRKGQFVRASGLFGTGSAVRDLAATLLALQLGRVDLYGDSYGTYFAQAFTARYPQLLRSVVLDSSYSVLGLNPWYPSTLATVRDAFKLVCERSAACAAIGADAAKDLADLALSLRVKPVAGVYRDPLSAAPVSRTVDIQALLTMVTVAGADRTVYRDLTAAARAYLQRNDPVPLLRLYTETNLEQDSGPYSGFSSATFAASTCADYPQLYSKTASRATREAQFEAAINSYPTPQDFAPFTVREWAFSTPGAFDTQPLYTCLAWPAPLRDDPPITGGTPIAPTTLPVLVLSGDLDSITPPADNQRVQQQMGMSARLVRIENSLHVTAYANNFDCGAVLIRAFVRQPNALAALDTSCTTQTPEIHAVGDFIARVADATPASAQAGNQATPNELKLAAVASAAAGDALFRYQNVFGDNGVGLRGGTWKKLASSTDTITRLQLTGVKWTNDASVSGQITENATTGIVEANLTISGPSAVSAAIAVTWDDTQRGATASLSGSVGGRTVLARAPAP